jgi:vancomycin resistance protein VanJ
MLQSPLGDAPGPAAADAADAAAVPLHRDAAMAMNATSGTNPTAAPRICAWGTRARWLARSALIGCWCYSASLGAIYLFSLLAGDRWWGSVLLLYGPRWLLGLPLVLFIPLLWCCRRWRYGLALAVAVVLVLLLLPVHVGMRGLLPRGDEDHSIRVISWNVGGGAVVGDVIEVMAKESADLVALQELDSAFALEALEHQGWHVWQGRGHCIISRYPIRVVETVADDNNWRDMMVQCEVDSPLGTVRLLSLHLPTPRHEIDTILAQRLRAGPVASVLLAQRREASKRARESIQSAEAPLIIVGDFNLVRASRIFREHWSEYHDAFAEAGTGLGWTKHTRGWGVRIDYILTSSQLRAAKCRVINTGSGDHRPVVADLVWDG